MSRGHARLQVWAECYNGNAADNGNSSEPAVRKLVMALLGCRLGGLRQLFASPTVCSTVDADEEDAHPIGRVRGRDLSAPRMASAA